MIKNIIFDIGNVILNFNIKEVLQKFTSNKIEQKFILKNIINSPEWLGNALIDTGYISREDAIEIVKDRTNHCNDKLIVDFWKNYNDFAQVNTKVLNLIQKLKDNNYKIYLLSNINPYTFEFVNKSGLFDFVDGYVLSYQEHKIKPYKAINVDTLKAIDIVITLYFLLLRFIFLYARTPPSPHTLPINLGVFNDLDFILISSL